MIRFMIYFPYARIKAFFLSFVLYLQTQRKFIRNSLFVKNRKIFSFYRSHSHGNFPEWKTYTLSFQSTFPLHKLEVREKNKKGNAWLYILYMSDAFVQMNFSLRLCFNGLSREEKFSEVEEKFVNFFEKIWKENKLKL